MHFHRTSLSALAGALALAAFTSFALPGAAAASGGGTASAAPAPAPAPLAFGAGKGVWALPGTGAGPFGHAKGALFAAPTATPAFGFEAKLLAGGPGPLGVLHGRLTDASGAVAYVVHGKFVDPASGPGAFHAHLIVPGETVPSGHLHGAFVVPPAGGPGKFHLHWHVAG